MVSKGNVNWVRVYNRLLEIINPGNDKHPNYFSGSRFIDIVRETDNYHPTYSQYIQKMKNEGVFKSRKDYFVDILESFEPSDRIEIIKSILSVCVDVDGQINGILSELGEQSTEKLKPLSDHLTNNVKPLSDFVKESIEAEKSNRKESWWGESLGLPSEQEYEDHFDKLIEKRMDYAEPYLQLLVNEGVVKMNIETLRAEFRKYYEAKHNVGDLQIKDGDFELEDGDLKIMPDVEFEDFEQFTKRFREFTSFMKDKGMIPNKDADIDKIVNKGNMIVNQNSSVSEQNVVKGKSFIKSKPVDGVNWTKWGAIIALVIGVITIIIMLSSS